MLMQTFTLSDRPDGLRDYRKKTVVALAWVGEPFQVETQEGVLTMSPETCDDWEGYYVAYPSDGSKPYAIAPKFVRENYVEV
jgi:hypothetical protein